MEIINITTIEQFEELILKSEVPVLVDFWATWCAPCRMMEPVLESLALDSDAFQVAKINVDSEALSSISVQYSIRSIPTMVLFQKGIEQDRFVGVQSEETLKDALLK